MQLLEKIALETLAKSLLEYKYRNYNDGSNWLVAGEKTRNHYRKLAYDYLQEGFYPPDDS